MIGNRRFKRRGIAGRMCRRVSCGALVVVAVAAVSPSVAAGGEFRVGACQSDPLSYSTRPFEDFATRGMWIKRACDPEGPGLRGLVTANVVRGGRVSRGARAIVTISAPHGTRFTTLRWAGTIRRRDCGYAFQLYADAPDVRAVPIKNVRADQGCPRAARGQGAAYRSRTFNIGGTTRIVQRIVCAGTRREKSCSARRYNFIRTYKATVGIADALAPSVAILSDAPLARGEWVAASQALAYDASDNVGVRVARAMVGGYPVETDLRPCVYADHQGTFGDRVPCPNGRGQITVDTKRLPEGSQPLSVQAEDAAANAAMSQPVTVRIDNTAPGAVGVGVEGGEEWRNRNDFALKWTNPSEGDRAPITAAKYKVCGADGGACTRGERAEEGVSSLAIQAPAPGEWSVAVWRRDAAGNEAEANASVPVKLRYDPEPPQLGFEHSPPSDPTLVSVAVTEKLSGMADGVIEISREGSGTWQALATEKHTNRLVARVDDAAMSPGTYRLRARAVDRARNEGSTDRRVDGQPMTVTLPLRASTTLEAGLVTQRTVRRVVRRGSRRKTVRRRVTVLAAEGRVKAGAPVRVRGVLRARDGQPVAGAQLQVFARSVTVAEHPVATVSTDAEGRYSYETTASASWVLRFVYPGSATTLPVQRDVVVRVPALSSFGVSRRRLLNGQAIVFRGLLRTLPVPAGGKLVEMQVHVSGGWQTFRTTKSDPAGRWAIRYRFRRTRGLQRFRFRVRMPAEASYPFETGASKPITVTVRGRR